MYSSSWVVFGSLSCTSDFSVAFYLLCKLVVLSTVSCVGLLSSSLALPMSPRLFFHSIWNVDLTPTARAWNWSTWREAGQPKLFPERYSDTAVVKCSKPAPFYFRKTSSVRQLQHLETVQSLQVEPDGRSTESKVLRGQTVC